MVAQCDTVEEVMEAARKVEAWRRQQYRVERKARPKAPAPPPTVEQRIEKEIAAPASGKGKLAAVPRYEITPFVNWTRNVAKFVVSETAAHYDMPVSWILGDFRTDAIVEPRHVCWYLLRKILPHVSLPRIGKIFARDHTTVIHGYRKIEKRVSADAEFAGRVEAIEANVRCMLREVRRQWRAQDGQQLGQIVARVEETSGKKDGQEPAGEAERGEG